MYVRPPDRIFKVIVIDATLIDNLGLQMMFNKKILMKIY